MNINEQRRLEIAKKISSDKAFKSHGYDKLLKESKQGGKK